RDAVYILLIELVLMGALLKMNAVDQLLQERGAEHFVKAGSFPVSSWLTPFFAGMDTGTLLVLER
ncbi:MAG: Fe-S oxidoreductase, partial [Flavobacteriales bacterium]|nr:Fe-S oxidoreductase [Flavobacteriales bacterium]